MEQQIREFITRSFRPALNRAPLDDDSPLFSSGFIDSFGVLELIAFLESTFSITLDPSEHALDEFDTIAKIVSLVSRLKR